MKVHDGSSIINELKLAGIALPDDVVSIDTHVGLNEVVTVTYTCNAGASLLIAINKGLVSMNSGGD